MCGEAKKIDSYSNNDFHFHLGCGMVSKYNAKTLVKTKQMYQTIKSSPQKKKETK